MPNNLLLRQKYHQYKSFTPAGVYLGLIQNVRETFNYNQTIASTFAQIQFTVEQSADVADQAVTPLQDEQGNAITDENNNPLLIERQPDIVGASNSNALIAYNNLIQVWEYSNYYPNGILKFSGYISKWKTTFGKTDDIVVTCISNGQDLSNYLVQSGDLAVISQTTDDGSSQTSSNTGFGSWILQTFPAGSSFQLSAISLELTATVQAQLQIEIKQQLGPSPNPGSDPIVASGLAIVPIQTKTVTKISMTAPTTLNPAYSYYIQIFWESSTTLTIFGSAANPYPAGQVYTLSNSGTTFQTPVLVSNYSLYFIVYQHGGNVTGVYTNEDPAQILTDVMSNYISQGGLITPPLSTLTPLASQLYGDTSIPGAFWSTAFAQIITPSSNLTFDSIQVKLPAGVSSVTAPSLYKGDPSLDSVVVNSGSGTYTLGGSNALQSTPATSTTVNADNGLATITFASPITLTGGQAYYLVWFFPQGTFVNAFQGASTVDPAPTSPIGALYSALVTVNNSSKNMSIPAGIQAMYIILALGAGSSPNGGFAVTSTLTTYTFKMQTIMQAIQAIAALAPSTWYWYVDPASGVLNFAKANPVADITIIRKRHIDEIDIEASGEGIINVAYFTGGDDGTNTSTNILVKVSGTQGTNRRGLAQLSDNRVNSTSGGPTTAKLIANNYLSQNGSQTYITNVAIQDQTMDINLLKLGMTVGFSGFGNFVDQLLLQVVGLNYQSDQAILQLGSLPKRTSKAFADAQAQLAYLQTVANPTTPS